MVLFFVFHSQFVFIRSIRVCNPPFSKAGQGDFVGAGPRACPPAKLGFAVILRGAKRRGNLAFGLCNP
jgi:hypothetical protein